MREGRCNAVRDKGLDLFAIDKAKDTTNELSGKYDKDSNDVLHERGGGGVGREKERERGRGERGRGREREREREREGEKVWEIYREYYR